MRKSSDLSAGIGAALLLTLGLAATGPVASAQRAALVPPSWRELGPAPIENGEYAGRISSLACSPTDPDLYYAGAADGGVWRTSDGGASWEPLTDHMPSSAIGALALDPSDERVLYAGTGEANYANHSRYGLGLYKSADGGDTWVQLAEPTFAGRAFSRIVVDPDDPNRLFASVTRAGGFPELAAAKGHPSATGPIGVFRSLDGGATWSQLTLPNRSASDVALHPTNSSIVYAAIGRIFGSSENGIYRSDDGGDSWTKLAGGLPTSSVGRISLGTSPAAPDRVFALVTAAASSTGGGASTLGAYRSDNRGGSWTSLPALGNIQASYGWYLSVVSVDPADATRVFMGGLTFHRSTNSGGSWSNATPPHVDLHAAVWDASGRLLVGDDGGVHRSSNGGSSWTSLNAGLGTIQFYAGLSTHPNDSDVVLGGTQDNGSNRRSSPGLEWTQVFGGDGGWTQIDQASPNRSFVEYQGTGNLFRSTGGGYNWAGSGISTSDRNAFLPPFLIDPSNSNRMIYGTQRVYRSTNGGTSWSVISGDLSNGSGAIRALAFAPSNPNVIYAATNDGNVQVSTNGGSSFQLVDSGRPGWPRVTREVYVHPENDRVAFLATASFGAEQVQRTTNRGGSWTSLDGDLPDVPVNVIAVLPARAGVAERIVAGTDRGVYVTANDGDNWTRYGRGLPSCPVIDLLVEPARNRMVVGTQGRGAWSVPLATPRGPTDPR